MKPWIVIPCYNESARLKPKPFLELAQTHQLLFVNDGSTDQTQTHLEALTKENPEIQIFEFPENRGKAEAVRAGMLRALESGAEIVGYFDADLSTPVEELPKLVHFLRVKEAQVVLGSRVKILGKKIERHMLRHYFGRIFATVVSIVLRIPIYDSQCGAKVFRNSEALKEALDEPFLSRWAFDVELLGRMLAGSPKQAPLPVQQMIEFPLDRWSDPGGSKLSPLWMIRSALELALIEFDLQWRRRRAKAPSASSFASKASGPRPD